MREKMREVFRRTREIWISVYAFIAGLNCGRGNWLGALMVFVGGLAVLGYAAKLQKRLLASLNDEMKVEPPDNHRGGPSRDARP